MRRAPLLLVTLALSCDRCTDPPVCDSTAPTVSVQGIWTIEGEGDRAGCDDPQLNGTFELGPSQKLAVDTERLDEPPRRDSGSVADAEFDGLLLPLDGSSTPGDATADRGSGATDAGSGLSGDVAASPDGAAPGDGGSPADASLADPSLVDGSLADDLGTGADSGVLDALLAADAAKDAAAPARPDARPSYPSPARRLQLRLRGGPAGFSLAGTVQGSCVAFETREETVAGVVVYRFTGTATSSREIEGTFSSSGPGSCSAGGEFTVSIR